MIMIKKARMDELISQDACIYHIFQGDIYLVDLTMVKEYGNIGCYEYYNDYYNCNLMFNLSDEIFENREDAEWYQEFGKISRSESLKLPTWKEFRKSNSGVHFFRNGYEYGLTKARYSEDEKNPDWRVEIYVLYNDLEESSDDLFSEPLTKENYIKACRKAKKLFLGEDDEG